MIIYPNVVALFYAHEAHVSVILGVMFDHVSCVLKNCPWMLVLMSMNVMVR